MSLFILGFPVITLLKSRLCVNVRGGVGWSKRKGRKVHASNTVRCHIRQSRGMFGKEEGRTGEHRPCSGKKKPSHLRVPQTPFLSLTIHAGQPGALRLLRSCPTEGPALPGSYSCGGCVRQAWLRPWPVTFSVDTQAPMVEPELTEVGELHSLTDWQVSDASEEAELDEFCRQGGATRGDQPMKPRGHQKS